MNRDDNKIRACAAAIESLLKDLGVKEHESVSATLAQTVLAAARPSEWTAGQSVEDAESLELIKLLSVIRDRDGIDAIKMWPGGAPRAHWVDDSGQPYAPVLPATILSVPSSAAINSASKGYLLDEDARQYWQSTRRGSNQQRD